MRWKKITITTVLLIVVMIVGLYGFLALYDFNKFKPMIVKAVKNATGRELAIAGDIEFELGLRPTLVVENVKFANASWSSTPELASVGRLEVQVAVLPLITGKVELAHLVLIDPVVIVEINGSGTNNFAFDTLSGSQDDAPIPPPPLGFSDALIENGLFTFKDARSGFAFSVRIDRLAAAIPAFDEPLQLDFKGAFDDKPLMLNGTVGAIWAWVEPGYALPADLTVTAGGASATIQGVLSDAINFKGFALDVRADGPSLAEITGLAGLAGVPELGAFKLSAKVNDSAGRLAVEKLDVRIGNQELAAIALNGDIKDILTLQEISLDLSVLGQDSANLTQLGFPALPEQGAFQINAQISDAAANVYTVRNFKVILGDHEVHGQVDLNLADKVPFLTAAMRSQRFRYGQLKLDLKITDPLAKAAIEKFDLKLGNPDLAKVLLSGKVGDLRQLQDVDIKFQASGKNLANFEKVTGQPFPLRGAFNAAGKVLIPVHRNLKIPDLKVTIGKNNIKGALDLDLRGKKPHLATKLSLPKLDLPSVLLPELAKQGWAKGLGLVRPVKLEMALEGFAPQMTLKKIDLRAGNLKSAKLQLTGSVQDVVKLHGVDVAFSVQGNESARLKDILAQPFLFAPVPGQGTYSLAGKISDPARMKFKIEDFKMVLADTELAGRVDVNLAAQPPQYVVDISGPKFNLKPFPIPKEAAYAKLNQLDDLGPLKIKSKVVVTEDGLSVQHIELQAGSNQLAAIDVKGSLKSLKKISGMDLDFNIQGADAANLNKIASRPVPLKGAFGLSGKFTDPAPKKYKLHGLKLKLGENDISGSLDVDLSGNKPGLTTRLTAPRFTLQPITLPALENLASIKDLGPLTLAFKLAEAGQKYTLDHLDLKLGRQDLVEVLLKGKIGNLAPVQGMQLEFTATGSEMSNFKKLGGPEIPFKGPFKVNAQFIDPAPKIYKIPELNVIVGENNQTGWLELDLSAKRPRVKGELSSDKLDLRPILAQDAEDKDKPAAKAPAPSPAPQPEKRTKGDLPTTTSGVSSAKVFSADPLPLQGLRAIDVDLKFREKQVLLPNLAFDDVILDILLKNGDLTFKPFTFSIGGGKADFQLSLRSQEKPSALITTLKVDQLEIGPMLDKLGYQRSVEGNLDADFDLISAGDSVAALMAALNGNLRIAMSNGKAASQYLELLERWLGSGILQMLNPFQETREYTPVNCFVNRIDIKDGLAEVKILLDTDRTSIFGAGDINLKTERLNLGIKPTPKKSAMPASVSFSFKELSQPFRLGGTLAQPALVIDPGRTAFVIGKMAGALALGPIGIAAFFADVSVGKKDACATALEASSKKPEGSAKKSDTGEDKKKEKKSGGFFKRLFGK